MLRLKATFLLILVFSVAAFANLEKTSGYDKTIEVKENGSLIINLNLGSIQIETWNENKVRIFASKLSSRAKENISIIKSENSIEFDYNGNYSFGNSVFVFFIPEKFNIQAETFSGNVELIGRLKGKFDVNTSGGNIIIDDVDGDADLRTSGGNIRLANVEGNLYAKTMGGNIETEDINGKKVNIHTSGGNLTIGKVKHELSATTYGGNIRVRFMGDGSTLSTYGGDIRLREFIGDAQLKTNGGDIVVSKGNGFVKAKTNGGDIIVKKLTGGIDLKTSAGSVFAELNPKKNLFSNIETSIGEVELVVPKNSDLLIDAKIRTGGLHNSFEINSNIKAEKYKTRNSSISGTYKLGNGSHSIKILTSHSDIIIHKK